MKANAMQPRQRQLVKMLRRPEGVTMNELARTFGWKPATAIVAISKLRKYGIKPQSQLMTERVYSLGGDDV